MLAGMRHKLEDCQHHYSALLLGSTLLALISLRSFFMSSRTLTGLLLIVGPIVMLGAFMSIGISIGVNN